MNVSTVIVIGEPGIEDTLHRARWWPTIQAYEEFPKVLARRDVRRLARPGPTRKVRSLRGHGDEPVQPMRVGRFSYAWGRRYFNKESAQVRLHRVCFLSRIWRASHCLEFCEY